MRRRPRLLLAGLGVTVAAGLALGFTLTRGGPENAFAQGPPGVLASGTLKTVSWGTNGTVTVERTRTGEVILRFGRDFRTQRAPALYVHMGSRRMVLQRAVGRAGLCPVGRRPGRAARDGAGLLRKVQQGLGPGATAPDGLIGGTSRN